MPSYAFMADNKIDIDDTALKMKAMKTLGVPYTNHQIGLASRYVEIQGREIANDLASQGEELAWDSEMVAIIAFLQRLGKHPEDPLGDIIKPPEGDVSSTTPSVPFERTVPGAPRLILQAPTH